MSPSARRTAAAGSFVLLLTVTTAVAGPPEVKANFHNSIDIAGFRSCAWKEGKPAPNRQVEETIRSQVRARLEKKGYSLVAGQADCSVVTEVIGDEYFPLGTLIVEVHERATDELAWRGRARGLVDISDPKETRKFVRKTVKKMFEQFPEARVRQR
jgi:hypothetical protein